MSDKLRELIAKWRRWHKNAVDPAGGMSVKAMATGETLGKCADELEALLVENAPEQAQEGLPTDVGHKFVVANGVMRFLAQAISRLDDVAQPATAKAKEGNAGGRKETSVPLAGMFRSDSCRFCGDHGANVEPFICERCRELVYKWLNEKGWTVVDTLAPSAPGVHERDDQTGLCPECFHAGRLTAVPVSLSEEQVNKAAGDLYFALYDAANDAEWGAIIEHHLHALLCPATLAQPATKEQP